MKAAPLVVAVGLLALSASRASAQVDFSGTWTLDREISADLTKASLEPQQTQTRRNPGLTGGFGGIGVRGGFGGRNGGGGNRGSSNGENRNNATALTVDEKARLKDVLEYVKGFTSLVIVHSDHSTFAVTDGRGGSRVFPTDGTKTPFSFAATTIDSKTTWDGPHMVTVYTISQLHDVVFTYVLVPATRQMALRVRLDESGRRREDVPELRLIYKLKP
jgi:hypothetical protein